MDLHRELVRLIDRGRVLSRTIDRIAWANDASVYRLVPRVVVQPATIDEIRALFDLSRSQRIPLTFRAAGTSLSGQAVTDGILAVVSRHWRDLQVEERGGKVRVQPGVLGGLVNRRLSAHGRKLGPDPASINACMMGGILANNSSGMCCGVELNAYHTLESMLYVLPDGFVVDSSRADADERLRRDAPELARGLLELKARVEADATLRERIRAKYAMKNTMGYSLNAFLDFARPVDILTHLMIGSEGTLGFIAEAVLRTIPDHPCKSTGLLYFPDVPRACAAIRPLKESGARALELMDRASLRSIAGQPGVPAGIAALPETAAAILVEYQCATTSELAERTREREKLLPELPLVAGADFTEDPEPRAALWRVRKGLIPSVGAMRRRGTSFIIEDVAFPVPRLAEGVSDLQRLFARHQYDDAIVFGHAKDGNLHFVLTQAFDRERDVERYDAFMNELAGIVTGRYGGALKAEHGTGRNMAPFLAAEWGEEAHAIMREIKRLVDPEGLLNPGVILNADPRAHVTHLKDLPTVESEVDACIECGFCERMCPSRDLTLTPRQRIVVRREMARARAAEPGSPLLRELEADYGYEAVESCAADGLCATACPVAIDTGELVKRLRREAHPAASRTIARLLADHFGAVERATRAALRAGHLARALVGDGALSALTAVAARASGGVVPRWRRGMPRPARTRPPVTSSDGAVAVFLPSCLTRVLDGGDGHGPSLIQVVVEVAQRAGTPVWIPGDAAGHCCGMPFGSKGYAEASRAAVGRTIEALLSWSDEGRLPVVVDSSPCALTLKHARPDLPPSLQSRFDGLRILDGIEFADRYVLPRLRVGPLPGPIVLHPVCSVTKMGLAETFQRVTSACAETAEIPLHAGCCGFAGDRGLSLPELTAAATRAESAEVATRSYLGYYSSSPTCEIGLTRATSRPYRSFWYLLEEVSR